MGKRYYCDYCDKSMVASPAIVRTHNGGLVHQQMVGDHYQQYKDIETILAEESGKKPCSRFSTGTCKYGSVCRFSHYSWEQMQHFQQYVAAKNQSCIGNPQPSFEELYKKLQDDKSTKPSKLDHHTILMDQDGVTHALPWIYSSNLDGMHLPPSLKQLKIEDFLNADIVEWGS